VASEREILIGWFHALGLAVTRIGLEAGPLSQWLYVGMRDAGLPVELLERAHLAIRHPPAGRQRVRPAQLTLSDPLHGEQPTADRVVSAE
jgi:hypothetical protein